MDASATAQLERRWAAEVQGRLQQLEALVARHSALLAAVHYSRALVCRWGWQPWRAATQAGRERAAAADVLGSRACLARAVAAWARCRAAAAWRAVAAEACAAAAARRQRQRSLQRQALAALQQHVGWVKHLGRRHSTHLTAAALRHWQRHAAATAQQTRQQLATAARHCEQRRCRQALAAWEAGALRSKQERVVAQRREQRWGTVQQYLAEHRQARAATLQQQFGGSGGDGGGGTNGCWADSGGNSSSAENSFDPNTIFTCSSPGQGRC
jgi:hypothetical protein